MKILLFSDSHGDTTTMINVVDFEKPNMIIHLGDHFSDGLELKQVYEGTEILLVRGNTDITSRGPDTELLDIQDRKIFLTHGHLYSVKNSLWDVAAKGAELGADIVLFGHTHIPYLSYHENIWLMNPGKIGRNSNRMIHATYGIINIEDGMIRCELREA